jgi:AcrR family transcriptional regulator
MATAPLTSAKDTRERLVNAARAVIDRGGYAAASVAAIADEAGVATGTLYRHFPSKAELFVEIVRSSSQRELGAMRAAATEPGTFSERLDAIVTTYARRALRKRRLAWALVYEPADPLVDAERLAHRREYRRHMADLLRAGIAAGEIPDQDADLTAAAIVGVISEVLVGPLSPVADGSTLEDEVVTAIVRFCREGVVAAGRARPSAR